MFSAAIEGYLRPGTHTSLLVGLLPSGRGICLREPCGPGLLSVRRGDGGCGSTVRLDESTGQVPSSLCSSEQVLHEVLRALSCGSAMVLSL